MVLPGFQSMDTRGKTNTEFRNEVAEILTRHEAGFERLNHNFDNLNSNYTQVNSTLQTVLTELQAFRLHSPKIHSTREVNPFATGETSHNPSPPQSHHTSTNLPYDRSHAYLKLSFPTFKGVDPTGWIYKAEQFFEFKSRKRRCFN